MTELRTELTSLLGVQFPIVSAPMGGDAGGKLAGHVSAGGGFGFIGSTFPPADKAEGLRSEIELAKSIANSNTFGVGFLTWVLEKMGPAGFELVKTALDSNVKAVWFSFGSDEIMAKWVNYVHDYNKAKDRGRDGKIVIFVQVSTIDEAVKAATEWKADVINIQSFEAGGHAANNTPPLKSLVPSVKTATSGNGALITGSGGLATGEDIASILDLGADGVVLGTRFLFAPEGLYTDKQRQFLVDAQDTVRSLAWDYALGGIGKWPEGCDSRGVKNQLVTDYEKGVDAETLKTKFSHASKNGEFDYNMILAGTGVGKINEVKPAAEIVKELATEASNYRKQ